MISNCSRLTQPQVRLTDEEVNTVEKYANVRTENKHGDVDLEDWDKATPSTVSRDLARHDNIQTIDEIGLAGELAFSKYYGIEFAHSDEGALDDGFDFFLHLKPADTYLTVDVKTTDLKRGNLIMQEYKSINADIYVLGIYDKEKRTVSFPGFTTGLAFDNARIETQRVHEPCRWVNRGDLIELPVKNDVEGITWEEYRSKTEL